MNTHKKHQSRGITGYFMRGRERSQQRDHLQELLTSFSPLVPTLLLCFIYNDFYFKTLYKTLILYNSLKGYGKRIVNFLVLNLNKFLLWLYRTVSPLTAFLSCVICSPALYLPWQLWVHWKKWNTWCQGFRLGMPQMTKEIELTTFLNSKWRVIPGENYLIVSWDNLESPP